MKLDMDLAREIAMELGESRHELEASLFTDERHDYQDVADHMEMMRDAGLIKARLQPGDDCWLYAAAVKLTWDGNQFLAAAKDDGIWRKVMLDAAKLAGQVPFSVLVELLKAELSRQLGLS